MSPIQFYNHRESITDVASRLHAIIDTAVDGIITIDEKGVIEFVNPATCKIFAYELEELLGQHISILMESPHKENHDKYVEKYMHTGERKIIGIGREVQGVKKNGTTFPFWLSVSEVKLEKKRMFTGIVHDLTEQKKAESALKRLNNDLEGVIAERTERLSDVVNKLLSTNQQLQHEIQERKAIEQALLMTQEDLKKVELELREALKNEKELSTLKSRFVSMASHEFRTPLSTILSSASLMLQYTKTEQQDKREKHFNKIKSSVDSLLTILNDFLSVSRLEEGRVEVQFEQFNFNVFCYEFIDELQDILKPGQRITHNFSDGKEMLVTLDKKILKLILMNLISNASKYSPEGTTIQCVTEQKGTRFSINIIDKGMGIPDEDKPHLFERFFRASNAVNLKGTGLGLHIVKRYVELLDGNITFKSDLNEGSTFTVSFNL